MPEETTDSLELLDWIVAQPWSNGREGLWGISYEGTRALLTGVYTCVHAYGCLFERTDG
jgi:predicted acyl esterase